MSCETIFTHDRGRMQIHVWMQSGRPVIKIYSKSKRDSTEDRRDTHEYALPGFADSTADLLQYNLRQSGTASRRSRTHTSTS